MKASSSYPTFLTFGHGQELYETQAMEGREKAPPQSLNPEHVLAEKRRRDKINHLFAKLSAVIPGLKKTTKMSLLGEAIKLLKTLKDKVRSLDEVVALEKICIESVTLEGGSSSALPSVDTSDEPKIKLNATMSENNVFFKIHCKTQVRILVHVLSGIEKLGLTIISTNFISLSHTSQDITVATQVEEGFSMTLQELVRNLNTALMKFI